ncbi:MAG: hypothetical protein N2651_08425 [Fimbriimonadales bacterium]|nr:hypothetical protein [Fimbriimonadales bacterium]
MGTAYTPGLTVSANTVILKTRRLPIKGEVLIKEGDTVQPDTVVARALLPGILQTVRVAQTLGIEPKQIHSALKVQEGDTVEKDQIIAETKGFLGLFRGVCKSPVKGTVELISEVTGHVGVRQPPTVIDVNAYVQGRVMRVMPQEGAVIETQGALIQGIFGVGGERRGTLRVLVQSPSETLTAQHIPNDVQGHILVGGAAVEADAIQRAAERGAVGIVAGGIRDTDLVRYLGRDIGVAITGTEDIPLSIIITEGFGSIQMANRTFRLLKSLEGKTASINGATQIRAGVIRPEIIVPLEDPSHLPESPPARQAQTLDIGSSIRVIREPYFGRLGTVVELPPELMEVESGTHARVLKAKLDDGTIAVVPRANVEIIVEE